MHVHHITGGGVDYDSGPYNVTFINGVTTVPFHVQIKDSDETETRKRFRIVIVGRSLPKGVVRGKPEKAQVIIKG